MEKVGRCTECGRVHFTRSSLCWNCWTKLCNEGLVQVSKLIIEKRDLELKVEKLRELCERLLDDITDNSRYTGELEKAIYSVMSRSWEEVQDGNGRVHENKNRKDG